MEVFLLVGVPALLLIIAAPIVLNVERGRKARVRDWAAAHGWQFQDRPRPDWLERLPGHLRRGRRRRIGVAVTGQLGGRSVTVAEYSLSTRTLTTEPTSETTHRYLVVLVRLDRPYPTLAVEHRGLASRVGRALFGDQSITTGNHLFDAQFHVSAANPAQAKVVITPQLITAHLDRAVPDWSLCGNELLTYTRIYGKLKDPSLIPEYATPLLRVADLLGRIDRTE